ncbi:MAG TPA: hypothetical protein VHR84_22025 [Terriglobales bacterium]|jgi:hypothetical protein|nr:hypothetical protein [Terriglobales bacterium]
MWHLTSVFQRVFIIGLATMIVLSGLAFGLDGSAPAPLDRGYQHLYDLEFDRAQQEFSAWQKQHPEDPMGPVSTAAGFLFAEFDRLGVLESQFYESDTAFDRRKKQTPDPAVRSRFDDTLLRSDQLARAKLQTNQNDRDALLAMALAAGLRADYAALIEKRNFASLHYTREATDWAERLIQVDPTCYDARLAPGISHYLIGSMSAPIRWVLHLGGVSGDKQAGLKDLHLTAEKGHYLAPFARILLAIAYVREHDKTKARAILASLQQEFPNNPLFAKEIARLDSK